MKRGTSGLYSADEDIKGKGHGKETGGRGISVIGFLVLFPPASDSSKEWLLFLRMEEGVYMNWMKTVNE